MGAVFLRLDSCISCYKICTCLFGQSCSKSIRTREAGLFGWGKSNEAILRVPMNRPKTEIQAMIMSSSRSLRLAVTVVYPYFLKLLSLLRWEGSAQAKNHLKIASPPVLTMPENFVTRSLTKGGTRIHSTETELLIKRKTDSNRPPSMIHTQVRKTTKQGNPGNVNMVELSTIKPQKLTSLIFSDCMTSIVSDRLVWEHEKRILTGCLHGGKIAEKANDPSNYGYSERISHLARVSRPAKLNSVLFYKVKLNNLSGNRNYSNSSKDIDRMAEGVNFDVSNPLYWPKTVTEKYLIEEAVFEKQMLLVRLAESLSTNLDVRPDTN